MMMTLLVLSRAGDLTPAGVRLCPDWERAGLRGPLPSAGSPQHHPGPDTTYRDCEPPHHQDLLHGPLPPSHLPAVQPGRGELSVQDLSGQHGETEPLILIGLTLASIPPSARQDSRRDFYQCLTKCSISACFHGEDFFIRSWEDFYSKFTYFTC